MFFAVIQWSPQSPGSKAGFIPHSAPRLTLHFLRMICFQVLIYVLFILSVLSLLPWARSYVCLWQSDLFSWLLLICCHLRKTNYIRIIWKVRIIVLWLWFRKPLIWVRCITFSVGSLVTHPLSDYFLMLANIQSQSQIVGNHSLGSLPGIKEVKVWVTWINKQNKYITDGLTVLRALSIP